MRKWASKWFDLPQDVTSDVPRVEVIGNERLKIENHRGVALFSPRQLIMKAKIGAIHITGDQLCIKAIYPEVVWVEGMIYEVKYQK